jgi:hypothetical protein
MKGWILVRWWIWFSFTLDTFVELLHRAIPTMVNVMPVPHIIIAVRSVTERSIGLN